MNNLILSLQNNAIIKTFIWFAFIEIHILKCKMYEEKDLFKETIFIKDVAIYHKRKQQLSRLFIFSITHFRTSVTNMRQSIIDIICIFWTYAELTLICVIPGKVIYYIKSELYIIVLYVITTIGWKKYVDLANNFWIWIYRLKMTYQKDYSMKL